MSLTAVSISGSHDYVLIDHDEISKKQKLQPSDIKLRGIKRR